MQYLKIALLFPLIFTAILAVPIFLLACMALALCSDIVRRPNILQDLWRL